MRGSYFASPEDFESPKKVVPWEGGLGQPSCEGAEMTRPQKAPHKSV